MNCIDNSKSLIENLSFLSGPVLAILGVFIFRQIRLAKEQLIISKRQLEESQKQITIKFLREAATFSANLTKEYIIEIIPLENEIYHLKKKENWDDVEVEIKNFTNDEFLKPNESLNKAINMPDSIMFLKLELANRLEYFAIYFTKGIADEKVAYTALGKQYCDSVEGIYPVIALTRGSKNPAKPYDNLVELYKCWNSRMKSTLVEFEKENLSNELKEKIKKLEQLKKFQEETNVNKPIGI
jgi:hypothetical protein